jgi:hypothetical protein
LAALFISKHAAKATCQVRHIAYYLVLPRKAGSNLARAADIGGRADLPAKD